MAGLAALGRAIFVINRKYVSRAELKDSQDKVHETLDKIYEKIDSAHVRITEQIVKQVEHKTGCANYRRKDA